MLLPPLSLYWSFVPVINKKPPNVTSVSWKKYALPYCWGIAHQEDNKTNWSEISCFYYKKKQQHMKPKLWNVGYEKSASSQLMWKFLLFFFEPTYSASLISQCWRFGFNYLKGLQPKPDQGLHHQNHGL